MAETSLVVVDPMPNNEQQQSHQDITNLVSDSMSIAHRIAPVVPSQESALATTQNHDIFGHHATTPKKPMAPLMPNTTNTIDISSSPAPNASTNGADIEAKLDTPVAEQDNIDGGSSQELQHNCSTNVQADSIHSDQLQKKKKKYEETIIDGFAICAFKSWEDLQDELNERIATDLKNHAAEKERDNISIATKRKHKAKHKNPQSANSNNPESQVKKEKVKRPNKESDVTKLKKGSSNGHPSTSGESKVNNKKQKESNKARELPPNDTQNLEKKPAQLQKKFKSDEEQQRISDNSNNSNSNNNHTADHVSSNRINFNQPFISHSSQTPQVHPVHSQSEKQSREDVGILANHLLKEPSRQHQHQSAQHSSFSSDSHLNRLYDVTSNIQPTIHNNSHPQPGTQSDQIKVQQYSQSQQHMRHSPAVAQHTHPPQTMNLPKSNQPAPNYQGTQSHMYQQHSYHPSSLNQNPPFYHNPMHQLPQPSDPYLHHSPNGKVHQANIHSSMPTQPNIQMQPSQHQYSQYQQHNQTHSQQPQPPSHMPQFRMYPPHMPQFKMYPSHMSHPTRSSSMVASMSMNALPPPYGLPYIVTDTTISRQTSIIPTAMPSALEQMAATSAANRFGHYPNMLHPMSTYNPATATMAQSSHHNQPPLYQSQLPTERGFMDIARGYNGQGGHLANYRGMINSPYPSAPQPINNTANPYSLDHWPKMVDDRHQRVVSRFNSLYNNGAPPTLTDTAGFGNNSSRPPMFHASLFPPPF